MEPAAVPSTTEVLARLRASGNPDNVAAVVVGLRLRESGSRAARWVASDALRELTDEKTIARIKL